jgi:ATP-dependent DNA ligase
MMANSVKEPFDSPDWIFEVKLDGYRAIAVFDDGRIFRLSNQLHRILGTKVSENRWIALAASRVLPDQHCDSSADKKIRSVFSNRVD